MASVSQDIALRAPARAAEASPRRRAIRRNLTGYLFIAPWLFGFFAFTFIPSWPQQAWRLPTSTSCRRTCNSSGDKLRHHAQRPAVLAGGAGDVSVRLHRRAV